MTEQPGAEYEVYDPPQPVNGRTAGKLNPLGTLVASARRLTAADVNTVSTGRRRNARVNTTSWQAEARDMFRLVGEFQYVVTTLAGRVGQAKLYVGKISPEDPSADPEKVEDDEDVLSIISTFGGTYAGRSQILTRLAVNLLVPGDGWLCGIPEHIANPDEHDPPPPGTSIPLSSLEWRMLSTDEIEVQQGSVRLHLDNYTEPVTVTPEQVYLIRVWKPDPFKWWEATSTARANLPVLKELVGLTMHVSAQVDSRLAGAGIFLVPQSAQAALQAAAGIDEQTGSDQFTEALIEAMLTPITDRGSASAVVPLVVTIPDEVAEKFKHITFSTPLDEKSTEMRDEAIRRLALGLDAPPEVLLGTSGSSHWASWFQDSDTIRSHVEPLLALICDALTTQYLWPVLKEMGNEAPKEYVVWYDVSHLISRPNRAQDAMALYDKGVLSDTALRRETGFDEDDAPEKDDPVKSAILTMVQGNPGMLRSPALPQMIESLKLIVDGRLDELGKKAEEEAAAAKAERAAEPERPEGAGGEGPQGPQGPPERAPVPPGTEGTGVRRLPQEGMPPQQIPQPPRAPALTSPVG